MSEPHTETRLVEIAPLGERLSALRLCEATALESVRRSLAQHGQLGALTLFAAGERLEIIDGFKRVRAARALGWPTLLARIDDVGSIDAKLRLRELHDRRGLTEIEEAWLIRSLYREDRVAQPEIARRMGRHKSWVWRRLMLVESLDPDVPANVRLGLIAARAAVAVSRLPRGNQQAASGVVIRRGLTVRQTSVSDNRTNAISRMEVHERDRRSSSRRSPVPGSSGGKRSLRPGRLGRRYVQRVPRDRRRPGVHTAPCANRRSR
jgi:ParB-like chromosome segregation protein Spo0J